MKQFPLNSVDINDNHVNQVRELFQQMYELILSYFTVYIHLKKKS
jgi:hypothetical protein